MAIATVNPTTGEVEKTFEPHTADQVEAILARADAANALMRATTFAQRSRLDARAPPTSWTPSSRPSPPSPSTEMGKTIGTAKYEVTKSANGMRHYADHAEEYLADEHARDPRRRSAPRRRACVFQPIGTVLAVMPWNYPFWQVIRFAAPALMAGNTGLLKHAS